MSYPSQPSFTPPYGQPPTPPRQNNLWLVGGSVVVVLAIIMTVVLVIVQRSSGSTDSGSGGDPTTTAEEPTDSGEPTSEEAEPTDGGGGGQAAGFDEETCSAFDLTKFEELFGESVDPAQGSTSATSSGDTGSLTCSYSTADFDTSSVNVSAMSDAESTMEWWEDDKEYWSETPDYTITDFTAFGDAGYHMIFGEGDTYQERSINVVVGAVQINVNVWVYPEEQDVAVADEYLQNMGEQAAEFFVDYQ